MESEEFYTVKDIAQYFGVSVKTVYGWIEEADLPIDKTVRPMRISKVDLKQWFEVYSLKLNEELLKLTAEGSYRRRTSYDRVYTVKQVAEFMGVTVQAVHKWINKEGLPAIGAPFRKAHIRIPRRPFYKWLQKQRGTKHQRARSYRTGRDKPGDKRYIEEL